MKQQVLQILFDEVQSRVRETLNLDGHIFWIGDRTFDQRHAKCLTCDLGCDDHYSKGFCIQVEDTGIVKVWDYSTSDLLESEDCKWKLLSLLMILRKYEKVVQEQETRTPRLIDVDKLIAELRPLADTDSGISANWVVKWLEENIDKLQPSTENQTENLPPTKR
jgi:hypothetical protein